MEGECRCRARSIEQLAQRIGNGPLTSFSVQVAQKTKSFCDTVELRVEVRREGQRGREPPVPVVELEQGAVPHGEQRSAEQCEDAQFFVRPLDGTECRPYRPDLFALVKRF